MTNLQTNRCVHGKDLTAITHQHKLGVTLKHKLAFPQDNIDIDVLDNIDRCIR